MPYSDTADSAPIVVEPCGKVNAMEHETDKEAELVTETLVEEVSIDGMCGVY
jgi:mycofactocin precursor